MFHRDPQTLEEIAFQSWLIALDSDLTTLKLAPFSFIRKALKHYVKLKDVTIIRLTRQAAKFGLSELVVNAEILNPALVIQLVESLTLQPTKIRKLSLQFSPTIVCDDVTSLLKCSLARMVNLEDLTLVGRANDDILKVLAISRPPLTRLDVSCSTQVTDMGLFYLIKHLKVTNKEDTTLRLQHLNIWETQATINCCFFILKFCKDLRSLISPHLVQAIVISKLNQSNTLRLEELSVTRGRLIKFVLKTLKNNCPCLKILNFRRPLNSSVDLYDVLSDFPLLEEFTLIHYYPFENTNFLKLPQMLRLQKLCLSICTSSKANFLTVVTNCPQLIHLTLDGFEVCLPEYSTQEYGTCKPQDASGPSFPHLKELKIMSCYRILSHLDATCIMKILRMTPNLRFLQLDSCRYFENHHFIALAEENSFLQMEEMMLSNAQNLSEISINALSQNCPRLTKLVLTMLSKEQRVLMENIKKFLRLNNALLQVVTFTNRSLNQNFDPVECGQDPS